MVCVSGLWHYYGSHASLQDVSFALPDTGIVCVLGVNGAGKSTLLKILAGCQYQRRGSVTLCGVPLVERPLEARQHIGYMPEQLPLYDLMTVAEYLSFVAAAKGIDHCSVVSAVNGVAERTGLSAVLSAKINTLSHGYCRRVALAQSLLSSPDVLILDEPANGLDPLQIQEFRNVMRDYAQQHLVILSTHILQEAADIADMLLLIHNGTCAAAGTVPHILQQTKTQTLESAFSALTRGRNE